MLFLRHFPHTPYHLSRPHTFLFTLQSEVPSSVLVQHFHKEEVSVAPTLSKCDKCDYKFITEKDLIQHKQLKHKKCICWSCSSWCIGKSYTPPTYFWAVPHCQTPAIAKHCDVNIIWLINVWSPGSFVLLKSSLVFAMLDALIVPRNFTSSFE